jgi:hypothetical protein
LQFLHLEVVVILNITLLLSIIGLLAKFIYFIKIPSFMKNKQTTLAANRHACRLGASPPGLTNFRSALQLRTCMV